MLLSQQNNAEEWREPGMNLETENDDIGLREMDDHPYFFSKGNYLLWMKLS